MARGVNKVILIGNLGEDPVVRHTATDKAVTSMSVATSEQWKDRQTGEKRENTEWHRVTMWGKLAEIAGQYLRKGSKVYLEGKLQTRKWQDRDGNDRWTTEILANEMQMLDGVRSDSERPPASQKQAPPASAPPDYTDDDIPF